MGDMMTQRHKHEQGLISGLQVAVIGLGVLVLGIGSFAIWAYVSYNEASQNLQAKIDVAVAQGQKDQQEKDQKAFDEKENLPNLTFKGPDDYCGLRFNYPKTWSAFVSDAGTDGGSYKAYFNPSPVPPIDSKQQYALRVLIERKDYDAVKDQYQGLITKGALKPSTTQSAGNEGTRLDGNFSNNIRGAVVMYKCRNYTISIFTDADTFKEKFDKLVQTIEYNK